MPHFLLKVQREDVLEAIREFDAGVTHPFGTPTKYYLVHNGKNYPPKAIAGIAGRRILGNMPNVDDLYGGWGQGHACERLARLGFVIRNISAVVGPAEFEIGQAYTREQIQRELGIEPQKGGNWATGYHRHTNGDCFLFPTVGAAAQTGHDYPNRWVPEGLYWFGKVDSHVDQPSIQAIIAPGAVVHLFARADGRDPFTYYGRVVPSRVAAGTSPIEIVWKLPEAPHGPPLPEEIPEGATYSEGAVSQIVVNRYERDPAARAACLKHWGCACAVCGVRLEDIYGPEMEGYIHVHHLKPLAKAGEVRIVDPVEDLRPVCPNCHAFVHRRTPPLGIDEAQQRLAATRRTGALSGGPTGNR